MVVVERGPQPQVWAGVRVWKAVCFRVVNTRESGERGRRRS